MGSYETPVECLFSKVILSLPTLNISDFFPEEERTNRAEVAEAVTDGVQLTGTARTLGIVSADTSKTSPDEAQAIEAARTFGIAPVGVLVEAFALDDYDLACKTFFNFLYLTDANKLLAKL